MTTTTTTTTSCCLALLLLALSGCGFELTDDVDLSLDFSPLSGPSDTLHSPYVKGARFSLFVHDTSDQNRVQAGWRIESSRPSVLSITDVKNQEYERDGKKRRYVVAAAQAVDEGQAEVVVRDGGGGEVYRGAVEVLRPDRVDLLAHGPLLIDRPAE